MRRVEPVSLTAAGLPTAPSSSLPATGVTTTTLAKGSGSAGTLGLASGRGGGAGMGAGVGVVREAVADACARRRDKSSGTAANRGSEGTGVCGTGVCEMGV